MNKTFFIVWIKLMTGIDVQTKNERQSVLLVKPERHRLYVTVPGGPSFLEIPLPSKDDRDDLD